MGYIKFIRTYRTVPNLASRAFKIIKRYGFSGNRMKKNIRLFVEDCNRFGICPTFPVTAQVLNKYPDFFQGFSNQQVEFSVHGYYLQDYPQVPSVDRREWISRAYFTFQETNLPVHGFRFPFLRHNEESLFMVAELPFEYDSSHAYWWNGYPMNSPKTQKTVEKMKIQYNALSPSCQPVLPRRFASLIEIPVSLPDDDLLVDRLGIRDKKTVVNIWQNILKASTDRGELFVMQLHPERFPILRDAFLELVSEIREKRRDVWIAPLREIANWWKKREQFEVSYRFNGSDKVRLQIKRPKNLNYRLYNFCAEKNVKLVGILQSELLVEDFEIALNRIPVIGVGKNVGQSFRDFLTNLGFPIDEYWGHPEKYSVYFETEPEMKSEYIWLEQFMNSLKDPLIRFNYWPEKYRSAFSVTGDIDAMAAQDFFPRIYNR